MRQDVPIAAIDAGSNAIRLAISTATSAVDVEPILSERVPVRLGHQTFVRGELDRETIDQAIAAFSRFRKLFDQHGIEHYRAVSTSAVRNAKNRETLINRLYHDTGIELEIIDGQEEARLVRTAVTRAFGEHQRPDAIVNLGGGSLEITHRQNSEWKTASMRIGTVRLMETFGLTGSITPDEGRMMRRYVASLLRSAVTIDDFEGTSVVAVCGGNAEEFAKLFGGTDAASAIPTLSSSELSAALPRILKHDVERRMSKFSIRRDRSEVIGIAGLVFAAVFEELGVERFFVPGVGIREGILFELAATHSIDHGAQFSSPDKALLASARAFAHRVGHDTTHGEQVRRIAASLFDQLAELHGLPPNRRIILEVAALLHDVGEVVHRRGHHKHGEYLILNGRIPGLDSPLREQAAALVRCHRKSNPYPRKHLIYAELSEKQQAQVRKLNALLRIADAIDTDHRQRVVGIKTQIQGDKVLFEISVSEKSGETGHLAERKTEAFSEEIGYEAEFSLVVVEPSNHADDARTE